MTDITISTSTLQYIGFAFAGFVVVCAAVLYTLLKKKTKTPQPTHTSKFKEEQIIPTQTRKSSATPQVKVKKAAAVQSATSNAPETPVHIEMPSQQEPTKPQPLKAEIKAADILPPVPKAAPEITSRGLAEFIKKKIFGQDSTVDMVAKAVALGLLKSGEGRKPTSLMLVGPSGTGKTEIAKQVADFIKGKFFVFNMNQFQSQEDIWSFFGPAAGFQGAEKGGRLPGAIREANASGVPLIIVLDEIEKANNELIQSFLSFLDEGIASDQVTKPGTNEIAPKKTLVFFTSNLIAAPCSHMSSNELREAVKQTKKISPECANRITSFVGFSHSVGAEKQIIETLIRGIEKEYGVQVIVSSDVFEFLTPIVEREMKLSGVRGLIPLLEGSMSDSLEEALQTTRKINLVVTENALQAKVQEAKR